MQKIESSTLRFFVRLGLDSSLVAVSQTASWLPKPTSRTFAVVVASQQRSPSPLLKLVVARNS